MHPRKQMWPTNTVHLFMHWFPDKHIKTAVSKTERIMFFLKSVTRFNWGNEKEIEKRFADDDITVGDYVLLIVKVDKVNLAATERTVPLCFNVKNSLFF